MITISLPWPEPVLFPNAARRKHWSTRAEAARSYRAIARVLSHPYHCALLTTPCRVTYTFHKPDNRVRDLNGCYGAMKSAEDGIADALGVDDRYFYPVLLTWGEVQAGGCVVVEIGG